jgi:hypothetical protein
LLLSICFFTGVCRQHFRQKKREKKDACQKSEKKKASDKKPLNLLTQHPHSPQLATEEH